MRRYLGLILILALGLPFTAVLAPDISQAQCRAYASAQTYDEKESMGHMDCDLNGNQRTTLGTLLNTEVPATTFRYISVGTTEDKHAVKTTAGTIFSMTATNTAATVAFLKCENDTSGNTAPGTDTPEFSAAIPGATTGGGFHLPFPMGFAFSTAWTCWIVTGAADTDVTEVAANSVMVFYNYK